MLRLWAVIQVTIDPISWDSAVAVALFMLAGILVGPGWMPWMLKKWRLRALFSIGFQPSQDQREHEYRGEASTATQRVHLSLWMALNTHVEFVALHFEGTGVLPQIQALDDWQHEPGKRLPFVIEPYQAIGQDHKPWYWQFNPAWPRRKGSRVTIGIDFLSTGAFDGHLVCTLVTIDTDRTHRLPFAVTA